jgi:predicted nuclease of restriction endonuclease-like RecB superfamily
MYAPKILIFYQSLGEIMKHKFGIQRSVEIDPKMTKKSTFELAVLVVFQQVEWHSFVYSSSCGCLLS